MNILFVMKHRGNAGNTHAVADYMRVAPQFGHHVAIFGRALPWLPEINFSDRVREFDRVVHLFESEIYRLSPVHEAALMGHFPRKDRMILDMDGMYNPVICLDAYDRNHDTEPERAAWIEHYHALADHVHKPTIAHLANPREVPLAFYGYDPALETDPKTAPEKIYDILHVGHNWWRGRDIENVLLPVVGKHRDKIGRVRFIGLWWDKPPTEAGSGNPLAFAFDSETFKRLNIETQDSVMYDQVVHTMSMAKINIFTQRPVLHHLRHLTLKYFEIFYADTIPLLVLDPDHTADVFGPAARELTLTAGRADEKILDALARPARYREIVQDVRRHLAAHHGYERRMGELVAALKN
jgi:hypothetical protein